MGLKDHLDEEIGHILDLGLDFDYLHVESTKQPPGMSTPRPTAMDKGALEGAVGGQGVRSSSSGGDSEESAVSDNEADRVRCGGGSGQSPLWQNAHSPHLDLHLTQPSEVSQLDPSSLDTLREYQTKMEFALKLGYSEELVRLVLGKLGPDALINDVLGELLKLGSKAEAEQGIGAAAVQSSLSSSSSSSSSCIFPSASDTHRPDTPPHPQSDGRDNLRPIVLDGSNVAMSHGSKEVFSCQGIQLAVDWFLERGHKDITVFVPAWRKEQSRPDALITDQEILRKLEKEKILVFTPSRRVQGRRVVCYDDRFIVKLAYESDGIIVSNDNYRDLANEKPEWKKFIDERLLMYSFVNDKFMPPDDPLGRHGPSLENFLRKRPVLPEHKKQPCPYGKKCTYGHKCKFYHPERGAQPQRSVADELRASARYSVAKSTGESTLVKSHSLPATSRPEAGSDVRRSAPKRQSEPSIRTQSHSDLVDRLSPGTKAEAHRSSSGSALPSLPPPPPIHCHPQEQRAAPIGAPSQSYRTPPSGHMERHPELESDPDLSYYSMMKAYGGMGVSSPRHPAEAKLRVAASALDLGSEGSVSCGSSSDSHSACFSERTCASSLDSLLEDNLKCRRHHHHHYPRSPPPLPQHRHSPPAPPHTHALSPPIIPGSQNMTRMHSFLPEDPPTTPHQLIMPCLPPYARPPTVRFSSSHISDYPPLPQNLPHCQGSPMGTPGPTHMETVSDSCNHELPPVQPRKPFPGHERLGSWEGFQQQHHHHQQLTFQDVSENCHQVWHPPWGHPAYSSARPVHTPTPRPIPQRAETSSDFSHYETVREKIFIDLCNIFPQELVRLVMGKNPHMTDAQQLAVAILAHKSKMDY